MEILGVTMSSTLEMLQSMATNASPLVTWFMPTVYFVMGFALTMLVLYIVVNVVKWFFHKIVSLTHHDSDPSGFPRGTYGSSERQYRKEHHIFTEE